MISMAALALALLNNRSRIRKLIPRRLINVEHIFPSLNHHIVLEQQFEEFYP
jgi:hypothetical protein